MKRWDGVGEGTTPVRLMDGRRGVIGVLVMGRGMLAMGAMLMAGKDGAGHPVSEGVVTVMLETETVLVKLCHLLKEYKRNRDEADCLNT